MTLIDDIRRDREAGTPGPWEKRSFQSGTVQVVLREWNNSKPDPTRDGSMYGYHSAYMTMYNIGWQDESDTDREKSANASRIARVPEMEARILADTEALKAADGLVAAAEALGAMPEGYCFCSEHRIGDDGKTHEPECADLRAAIATYTKARKARDD